MATTLRLGSGSAGSIFLFYPDIARAMGFLPARTGSIRDQRRAGVSWEVVARVITHEILHYSLAGRPHDEGGIFREHLRGDVLLSANLEVCSETQALRAKLSSLR